MNKNLIFLTLAMAVAATEVSPAERHSRGSHRAEPYNVGNAARDQRAQRRAAQNEARRIADEAALQNAAGLQLPPAPIALQQLVANPPAAEAAQDAEQQCPICQSALDEDQLDDDFGPALTEEEAAQLLTCRHHEFHQRCLSVALAHNNTCPLCRAPGRINQRNAINNRIIRMQQFIVLIDQNIERGNYTNFFDAASNGNTLMVRIILSRRNVNVNARDEGDYTALHYAADNGHTETVHALINAGAAVDAVDEENATALHVAADNGHTETVHALIDRGADVNAVDLF